MLHTVVKIAGHSLEENAASQPDSSVWTVATKLPAIQARENGGGSKAEVVAAPKSDPLPLHAAAG